MTAKVVMLAWVDAFNRRDADALIPLYHPEATNHQVAAGEPVVGRDAIIRDSRGFFAAFPDSYTTVEAMHQDGEWVMLEWSGGATWLGEFAGRQPNGKTFTLRGCGFFHIVDGQIRFQRGYWDRAGWFLQLGITVE
ncbi:SnoaL-like polyketide cyclase OS=Synechococcus sp. (strain ATCC 27167 / PCC 6312) GN=Syn6312_0859 PE=4 SV=1: SnoaL [Gemmataceae bacterium]|nr:SnoaL-like polyketide cyclase OS=Synechococcus sp. (strain ATCC 27167 / PCC 6312) GN=Syn6312_0859 PE=4 SV=1: SnoaL [Gemmataceae bacterium]VTT98835.1 SnoaL-like polyketide cyclase OS=Synechococcus sp. (strain ATCC 27167 / PCC 6312) GN=Syn6312_0859 PE=4 SV=1: SnoaL [Gemmataceae bacterium]